MSEMSRQARRAARAKIHRLTTQKTGKVDASDYGPEEDLGTTTKTGLRPVSRRNYKRGGKVEGAEAPQNAGKKPRKSGGSANLANQLVNRNVKDANEDRAGARPISEGGLKSGGRAKRATGGGAFQDRMRSAALLKDSGVNGPGGSSYKRHGSTQDVVETHHGSSGTRKALMGKTGKFNVSPSGEALPAWAEKYGPLPRKSGGRAERDAGGEVPTTRFNIGAGESIPRKMMGFKKGGRTGKSVGGVLGDLASSGLFGLAGLGASSLLGKGNKSDGDNDESAAPASAPAAKNRGGALGCEMASSKPTGGRTARKSGGGNWIKGAIKHPGALHKQMGIPEGEKIPAKKLAAAAKKSGKEGQRARLAKTLGRMPRKSGGRAKGNTDINIIIGRSAPAGQPQGGAPGGMPAGMPVPVGPPGLGATGPALPGGPPPGMPMPPPGGAPGGMPVPMPRKSGGRTYRSHKDMDAGAGSGKGRQEKTEIAKHKD